VKGGFQGLHFRTSVCCITCLTRVYTQLFGEVSRRFGANAEGVRFSKQARPWPPGASTRRCTMPSAIGGCRAVRADSGMVLGRGRRGVCSGRDCPDRVVGAADDRRPKEAAVAAVLRSKYSTTANVTTPSKPASPRCSAPRTRFATTSGRRRFFLALAAAGVGQGGRSDHPRRP